MKKLLIPILVSACFVSCTKKNTESTDSQNDSVIAEQLPEETTQTAIKLAEYTPEQISKLLQTKNDTLYVTNFFATWCGPCIMEIPHFQEKMVELKDTPVKFTFVSLDDKSEWDSKVTAFVDEHKIRQNTILMDGQLLDTSFFSSNFKTWKGETIPFTLFKKGDKTEEINGSITKEKLTEILQSFQ